MNTQSFIDSLFKDYVQTEQLADFKEELKGNLDERIKDLIEKGKSPEAAFSESTSELSDISGIAEEMSFMKKKEVYETMYLQTKKYVKTWQALGYSICAGIALFGIIVACVVALLSRDIVPAAGTFIVFIIPAVSCFVFIALTQETARLMPMGKLRALFYAAAVALFLFGIAVFVVLFVLTGAVALSIAALVPFNIPAVTALICLILTGKDRHKPWAANELRRYL